MTDEDLSRFSIPDVPLPWLDGRRPSEAPRSVSEEQCDFCSAKGAVLWTYRATVGTDWGACQDCHALIEAKDRAGLIERSVATSPSLANFSRQDRREAKTLLRAKIKDLHDSIFWRYCTTPPVFESLAVDGETQRREP